MNGAAMSLQIATRNPERIARRFERARAFGKPPTAGIVFLSGSLTRQTREIAELSSAALPGAALLIVAGAGTLSDEGELEREASASAVFWRQGNVYPVAGDGKSVDESCACLAERIASHHAVNSRTSAVVFVRPDGISPAALGPLAACPVGPRMFGGGTIGGCDPVLVQSDGSIHHAPACALLMATAPPHVRHSPACRMLCAPMMITRVRGSMVLELDNEPALEVLSRVGKDLPDSPLVFAVLSTQGDGGADGMLVRAVQGIDPMRGGLMVSEEVEVGRKLSFGIRDAVAARSDLERTLREMEHELAGAAPIFGVYINCAGRGIGLYGHPDVDSRLIRTRFDGIPVAGMHSSFEIVPLGGSPVLQLYSGVMALFTAPS